MRKIAFICPGQGSQRVGMGQDIYQSNNKARQVFTEADEILGFSLSKLCFQGPEAELRRTVNTQPAILTASIALYLLLKETDIKPDFVAGHSLGEYTALVISGAISFADAVRLVHLRGTFMENAVPAGLGAMSAVLNGEREAIIKLCLEVSRDKYIVEPANFNCPGQIVISGHSDAVKRAGELMLERNIARKVIPLPVSGPFHSSLMQPAADRLRLELNKIELQEATIPVIANVSGRPVTTDTQILSSLIEQIDAPVRWEESVQYLLSQGVNTFVEIGPGQVLSGLVKKIDRSANTFAIQDKSSLDMVRQKLEEEIDVRK